MSSKRKSRKVGLAFVNLGPDAYPEPGQDYALVSAASTDLAERACPNTEYKLLRVQLLNLYVENLPDFANRAEGLLTIEARTRMREDKSNKEDLAFSLKFSVKDRDYAPGFLQRLIFRNVLVREFFELGIDLAELDSQFSDTYAKVAGVVDESGLSSIDAINSVPYIKVASKLFDGLTQAFGKDADDVIWSEMPSLQFNPSPGGAFLRTGIYVLHEWRSLYSSRVSRQKKRGRQFPLKDVAFRDGKIAHRSDAGFPLPNHLVFSLQIDPHPE